MKMHFATPLLFVAAVLCAGDSAQGPFVNAGAKKVPGPDAKEKSADEKTIRALIADLSDDVFETREKAHERLLHIGGPAVELLRKASKDGVDLEVRERARENVDWREVVTSIRADTPALWQRLDPDERRRFLRHARPYWETHRHRSSPEAAHAIEELIETGRLEVVAGSLEALAEEDGGVVATIRCRGASASERLRVGKVINCTGPDTDLSRRTSPTDDAVTDPLTASAVSSPRTFDTTTSPDMARSVTRAFCGTDTV